MRSRSWRTDVISSLIAPFEGLPADAISIAGGKGASLARMAAAGLPVPRGFVVCTAAFHSMLESGGAGDIAARLSGTFDVHDSSALDAAAEEIQTLIKSQPVPDETAAAIRNAYRVLGADLRVAVRSSAVSEDGEAASFAGQQETFLNVRGEDAVLGYVRECWASFFSPRALFYRAQKGALSDTRMAVVVQEMVLAEKSGVLFTVDPILKQRDRMIVEAVFGLGEGIVSGAITPDHYVIDRETGEVLDEFIAHQEGAVFYDPERAGTRHVELSEDEGSARVLTDDELTRLRATGLQIEEFFGRPQDVEWSIRGNDLLLLQSRPITTL